MTAFFIRLSRTLRPAQPIPARYRQTFFHLFMDITWFGILSGTTIAFLAVFATRQGASAQQIGILSAVPGLVNLIFALPVGSWLSRRPIGRAVFWSSVLNRVFYLLLIPLPVLLLPKTQVWVIIGTSLVMTIPGTAVVVGFNALFGEVVPLEWRGYVVGIRNALLSVMTVVFTLLSGVILDHVVFPHGYQIVFTLGVIGAGMSSLHMFFLSRIVGSLRSGSAPLPAPRTAAGLRLSEEIRGMARRGVESLRLDAMQGRFRRIMGLLFFWHLAQFMAIPTFTPFIVNQLHLDDQRIGFAGALFSTMTFLGSLGLSNLTVRFGNKRLTGGGILGLSLYPILTSLGVTGYFFANLVGGLFWAVAGGALYNYILENVPGHDLPAHLAWYNLVLNAAILLGSLVGPTVAGWIGFAPALVLFGIGRFLAGVAILKWG